MRSKMIELHGGPWDGRQLKVTANSARINIAMRIEDINAFRWIYEDDPLFIPLNIGFYTPMTRQSIKWKWNLPSA